MKNSKSGMVHKLLIGLITVGVLWTTTGAAAARQSAPQSVKAPDAIEPGTRIYVRPTEAIDAAGSASDVFSAVADRDILGSNGQVIIPRGSDIELVARKAGENNLVLDIDSIIVNGLPYVVDAVPTTLADESRASSGETANRPSAVIARIIGPTNEAIGGGSGAGLPGTQMSTRGEEVHVPAESLLVFELIDPLRAINSTFLGSVREKPTSYPKGSGKIYVGADKSVTWEGPEHSSLYVQVDNEVPRLFSAENAGTQPATWIKESHLYSFILKNAEGDEIARTQLDFRPH